MKTMLVDLFENRVVSVTEDMQIVLGLSCPSPQDIGVEGPRLEVNFEKEGVAAQILGLYRLDNGDILNFSLVTRHLVPNTNCVITIKGVLFDAARSDFAGKIYIDKRAPKTNSFLEHRVLTMGGASISNSEPTLEINANDVKASHAATTGPIDEAQIYYLESRGLSREEAQGLIIRGFFDDLLGKITDDGVRNKIAKEII